MTFPFVGVACQALRVSMEEQRQRQEEETRRVQHETIQEMPGEIAMDF